MTFPLLLIFRGFSQPGHAAPCATGSRPKGSEIRRDKTSILKVALIVHCIGTYYKETANIEQ